MPKTNACKESVGPTVEKFTLASPSSARDLVDAMASSSAQAQCIVLVGGGHAHAQVIKALNAWARPARVRVVLIDPQVRSRTASWLFVHPRPRAPCRSAGERFPGAGGCSPIWHGVGGFTSHSLSSRSTRRSAPPPPARRNPHSGMAVCTLLHRATITSMAGCGFPAWRWRARANSAPGVGGLRPCAGGGGLLGHGARLRERALRARRHAHPPRPARGLGSRRARGVETRLLSRRTSRAVTRRRALFFFAVRIIRDFDFIITTLCRRHVISRGQSPAGRIVPSLGARRLLADRRGRPRSDRAARHVRRRPFGPKTTGGARARALGVGRLHRRADDGRRRARARCRAVTPPCRARAVCFPHAAPFAEPLMSYLMLR